MVTAHCCDGTERQETDGQSQTLLHFITLILPSEQFKIVLMESSGTLSQKDLLYVTLFSCRWVCDGVTFYTTHHYHPTLSSVSVQCYL